MLIAPKRQMPANHDRQSLNLEIAQPQQLRSPYGGNKNVIAEF
jgi:hypothetical protein